jgi:hypothetical protein
MVSFAKWLTEQSGRQDATGAVARMWAEDPTRGNISSIKGFLGHVESWDTYRDELEPGVTVQQASDRAIGEWRRERVAAGTQSGPPGGPPVTGPPGQPELPPEQPGVPQMSLAERNTAIIEQAAQLGVPVAMTIMASRQATGNIVPVNPAVMAGVEAGLRARLAEVSPDPGVAQIVAEAAARGVPDAAEALDAQYAAGVPQDREATPGEAARDAALMRGIERVTGEQHDPGTGTWSRSSRFEEGGEVVMHWTSQGTSRTDMGRLAAITTNYVQIEGDGGAWIVVPWGQIEVIMPQTPAEVVPVRFAPADHAQPPAGAPEPSGDQLAAVVPFPSVHLANLAAAFGGSDARAAQQTAAVEEHHRTGQFLPPGYVPGQGEVPHHHWSSLYAAADHDAQYPNS